MLATWGSAASAYASGLVQASLQIVLAQPNLTPDGDFRYADLLKSDHLDQHECPRGCHPAGVRMDRKPFNLSMSKVAVGRVLLRPSTVGTSSFSVVQAIRATGWLRQLAGTAAANRCCRW